MKEYRRRFMAVQDQRFSAHGTETSRTDSSKPNQAAGQPKLNRRQRRQNAVFNRLLQRRLEKDNTPVRVEALPDGGLHVTVSKEEVEMRHAEEEETGSEDDAG